MKLHGLSFLPFAGFTWVTMRPYERNIMETRDLEFLIEKINTVLERMDIDTKELFNEKEPLNNDPRWVKRRFSCIVGEAHGTMAFVRDQLTEEIKNRRTKKFYEFWK